MPNAHHYRVSARWTRARRGVTRAEGVPQELDFASPPEFQGEPGLWTPEHLITSAVATCFVATFRAIAEFSKFEAPGLEAAVEGILKKGESGYRFTRFYIRPVLTLAREEDRERGLRLLEKAEKACLISRSLSGEMVLEPKVEVAAPSLH